MPVGIEVFVEGLGRPVVSRDVMSLPALLVEPQPPPAPLLEVVLPPHPQDRAHPREAVEHHREERPVSEPGQRARVDVREELPRFGRGQNWRRALGDDVLRPPHRGRGVHRDDLADDEPVAEYADPETGTLYVSTSNGNGLLDPDHAVTAFDLRTGERLWEFVAGGDTNAFDAEAPAAVSCPGGPLLTKTLVIHCRGGARTDGRPRLVAYNKTDGRPARSLDLPRRAIASPLTYMIGEVQYLAVAIEGNQLVGYALEPAVTPVGVALTGWDRDQNGLRDDVQGVLARMYEDEEIRAVMEGGIRAYQMAVLASVTIADDDDVAAAEAIARFVWCLNEYPDIDTWREMAAVQFLVLDTDTRDAAYQQFESGRRGALPRVVPASPAECTI